MEKEYSIRLRSDERRTAIVKSVRAVFARKGFHGTTTKELAAAAGVSEALLFKHFPNKEALYDAMIECCSREPGFAEIASNRFAELVPSAAGLVVLVHYMVSHFVECCDSNASAMDRLAVQSLLADGAFLHRTIHAVADTWIAKFEECITAAAAGGDMHELPVRPDLRFWFAHHLAFGLRLHLNLPDQPALDYRVNKMELVEQAVWFALLGLGMKEASIRRWYVRETLAAADLVRASASA